MMKITAILMSLFMLFVFTAGGIFAAETPKSAPAVAATETIQGKITKIDTTGDRITVMVGEKEQTLTAEKKLLATVKVGDMVSIEKNGEAVKTIKVMAPPAGQPATPPAAKPAK